MLLSIYVLMYEIITKERSVFIGAIQVWSVWWSMLWDWNILLLQHISNWFQRTTSHVNFNLNVIPCGYCLNNEGNYQHKAHWLFVSLSNVNCFTSEKTLFFHCVRETSGPKHLEFDGLFVALRCVLIYRREVRQTRRHKFMVWKKQVIFRQNEI